MILLLFVWRSYMNKNIKTTAQLLINKYKTNNPFELASALNIVVHILPLGNIKGFYKYYKRTKIIFINSELDYFERLVVCAHELGHALFHPRVNIIFLNHNTFFVGSKLELEANKFASELLLSDEILLNYSECTFEQIAAAENLNKELVILKFQ